MNIKIISAPSILGLRPSGVELMADTLLERGFAERIGTKESVVHVATENHRYSAQRDPVTNCLNPQALHDFSVRLARSVQDTVKDHFPMVLGGDCSILVGIMAGLKAIGTYGIISLDAHADFYQPEKSTTGEAADMDMALITGRGPEILTDIHHLKPYLKDEHAFHIGQRDWDETQRYGSQDIRQTSITCFDLETMRRLGIATVTTNLVRHINALSLDGLWLHYDTDVLSDDINPAVDYRLPGGLTFEHIEFLMTSLLRTGKITGLSITIYNPSMDPDHHISAGIINNLSHILNAR